MGDSDNEVVWKMFKEPKSFSWKRMWWFHTWTVVKFERYNNNMNLPSYPPYYFDTEDEAKEFIVLKKFEHA
jgi:hypothetical protein